MQLVGNDWNRRLNSEKIYLPSHTRAISFDTIGNNHVFGDGMVTFDE